METGSSCLPRRAKDNPPPRAVTVRIDEIGAKGDGVAMRDGAPVFIPYTAPGDLVRAEVSGDRGRRVEILEPGPDRRAAPCSLYGRCGGCALQHVAPDFYRAWKRAQVSEALRMAGLNVACVAPLVEIAEASRRRATFTTRRSRDRDGTPGVEIGFFEKRSRRLAPLSACLVLDPSLMRQLDALRAMTAITPDDWGDPALAVTLCDNGLDVNFLAKGADRFPPPSFVNALPDAMAAGDVARVSVNSETILQIAAPIVRFGDVDVTPPAGGFLQASRAGEAALIELVREGVGGVRRIVDLFSGCGTFTLPLATSAGVAAFDNDAPAVKALKTAAAGAQASGLRPVRATMRNLFERPLTAGELNEFDAIVIDPPRAGAIAQAREIAASRVPRIVAVSCNPKTFARDARILADGGYRLTQVTPVDQFVYSPHIEVIGVFEKG